MGKKPLILPGQSSEDFPSIQEKNLQLLTEILKKKEVTDAITVMGKIETETWVNIQDIVMGLKEIMELGGTSELLTRFAESVDDTLSTTMDTILSPLENTFRTVLGESLSPINDAIVAFSNTLATVIGNALRPIVTFITPYLESLSRFISGNQAGAFFGALAGSLLGPIGTLVGGIVGAAIEHLIEWLTINWGKKPSDIIEEVLGEDIWDIVFPPEPELL